MLNITVSNMIRIPMDNPHYEGILEKIRDRFVYPNPIWKEAKRRGYKTHGIDPYVQNWNFSLTNWVKHLDIPRGGMVWLKQFLFENKIPFTVNDERSIGFQFEVEWNDQYSPHDYQELGKDLFKKYQQGFWCYNPGAGKTVLALYSISEIKTSTLIIVNSNELLNQWRDQIREFLHYNDEIGLIQQDVWDLRPITVATIQTLQNRVERLGELNEYFGCIIHDEAHHSPADGNQIVLNRLSQKYRMALTASTTRKDGLEFLAYDYYDSIRQTEKGKVMIPTVQQVNTGIKVNWTKNTRWTELEKALSDNPDRNQFIANNVKEHIALGHPTLVLFTRNDAALNMTDMLQRDGIRAKCLISGVKMDLKQIKKETASRKIEAIVACRMFDEGIDNPPLSAIHLCSPSSNKEAIRQRTGRITRLFPGKLPPEITDYRDDIQPCKTSALKRLQWYKEFGYNVSSSFMARISNLW